jgi:hypothetical protein
LREMVVVKKKKKKENKKLCTVLKVPRRDASSFLFHFF